MSTKKTLFNPGSETLSWFDVVVAWIVLFTFLVAVESVAESVFKRLNKEQETRYPVPFAKVENGIYAGTNGDVALFLTNDGELRTGDSARLVVWTEGRTATVYGKVAARVNLSDDGERQTVYALIEVPADDVRRVLDGRDENDDERRRKKQP